MMAALTWVSLLVALALLIYLVITILFPDRF